MKLSTLFILFFSASVMGFGQPDKLAAKSQTAREAMSEGRFVDAIPIYEELIKALPGEPGLKMNLGIAHYMAGQYRESIRQLDPVVRTNPELTEALLFLGASQHQVGNPAGAVPPLRRYVQKKSGDPRGLQLLGESLLAIQRFEEAAAQFGALGKLEPENPKAWSGLGRSYEGLAARAFERLEKLSPESAYGFALIAATRAAQNQYRSAFFFYRKALEKQPKMRGVHVALSQVYRKAGHPEWAAQEEQKEIELGLPDCVAERIICDFLAGRFKEVLDAAKREQTPQSYYWRSQAYNQLALDSLSRLAQLPPSFEWHEVMAEIYRNQGRHVESIKEWKKALALSPDNPLARRELAVSLLLTQDYETAKPLVESLLKENPRSAQLNYLAGDILLNQQRPVDAVPFLRKAVEYDPGLSPAHASLGRAYITFGEAAKAIPHLKSALVLDQDGSLHYQLARAYRSTGALELAGQMLQKYQQIQKSAQEEKERLEQEARITPPQ